MTTQKIGRYEIKQKLGQGGMASVYIAHDPMFERDVAVKLMPEQFINDEEFARRFRREAKTIATLEHSAIVPVYDYGEQNGQPFLVMRYMPGGSLADRLRQGQIPFAETIKIFRRIGEALDHAHRRGIVHRDLKPANILFDQYGDAYLADFGIVQVSSEDGPKLTQTGRVIGTPTYMSPEQVYGDQKLDGRSDIYALGVILFQMLTGTPPYLADTPAKAMMKHVLEPVPEINRYNPNLPNQFNGVVQKAMAKDRDARFSTATDLTNALDTAMKGSQTGAPSPVPTPPPPPPAQTPASAQMPPTMAYENVPSRNSYGISDQVDALKQSAAEIDAASGSLGGSYGDIPQQRGGIPTWVFVLVGVVGLACIGSAIVLGIFASRSASDSADERATETAVFAGYAESTEVARAATADAKDDFSVEETRVASVQATDEAFAISVNATATAFFLASAEETKAAALVTEEAAAVPTKAPTEVPVGATTAPPTSNDRALLFGPADGAIPHEVDDDFVESIFTDLNVRDFILQATIGNPFDGASGQWDVGFLLRQTGGNDELRLVIQSDSSWALTNRDGADELDIHEGTLTTLRNGAGDANSITVIAINDRGYFFFNDELIQVLDLSSRTAFGDVAMSTGFFADSERAGASTPYKQLTVHSLDPLFGPRDGELAHILDNTVKARSADVNLLNFIAEATFINPYDPSVFDYDWGFDFRKPESGEQFWLIINSNQGWDLVNRVGGDDGFLQEGTLPTMETGLNGRNKITLIALGAQGFFLHNDQLISTLDLRVRQTPGDIELVTAFYIDSEVEGEATGYESFTVWGLPD